MLLVSSVFILGLGFSKRFPRVPVTATLATLFLVIAGWLMTANCQLAYDAASREFARSTSLWPDFPGYLDFKVVLPEMLLATGLAGCFLTGADMTANAVWRRRLLMTLAGTGFSIVLLGLAQRLTNATAIFWNIMEQAGGYFFGVFVYHANAGAFLNITLFLCAALAIPAMADRKERPFAAILWTTASFITLGACFVNASKGAMAVTVVVLLVGGLRLALMRRERHHEKRTKALLAFLGVVLIGAALALSFGIETTVMRWQSAGDLSQSDRWTTDQCILDYVLPVTGIWGTGPGTFEEVFACVIEEAQLPVEGRWDMAHCDPLQSLVEWGVPGTLCILFILLGGVIRGIMRAEGKGSYETRVTSLCASLAVLSILLHCVVDFPLQIASIALFTLLSASVLWGRWGFERAG